MFASRRIRDRIESHLFHGEGRLSTAVR